MDALSALARAYGLETAYRDGHGRRRVASDAGVRAVLAALGVPAATDAECAASLRAAAEARWARLVEPVVVAWDGLLASVDVRARPGAAGRVRCHVETDAGAEHVSEHALAALHVVAEERVAGRARSLHRVPLRLRLPLGRHRLAIELGRAAGSATVLAAPRAAWRPAGSRRSWGLFAPLHALRGRGGLGCGDVGDLAALVALAAERGAAVVGTLPLLPLFLDRPFEPSPYSPVSRRFWNDHYADLEAAPELAASASARRLLESAGVRRELARLRAGPHVDHRRVHRLRARILDRLAAAVAAGPAARRDAFEAWRGAAPETETYARFRAVAEETGRPWREWPAPLRRGTLLGAGDPQRVQRHLYGQWLVGEQLGGVARAARGRGVALYLDLPLGAHRDGYDTWRSPELFARGATLGAPPDPVFADGQDWAIPPLHPARARASGHEHLAAVLDHHMRVAGVLRIDHVMGLHRQFWVPAGLGPAEGVYVHQRPDELYAILALASHRAACAVVGEDLGTVPPGVRAAMRRHGIGRMHVVQYELAAHTPVLPRAPARSVASVNTHDMPPFAGWWWGRDIEDAAARGLLARGDVAAARRQRARARRALVAALGAAGIPVRGVPTATDVLALLARGPAALVLGSLEDLVGATAPQNRPGTPGAGNWSRRLGRSLARLAGHPALGALEAAMTAAGRRRAPARSGL